MAEMKDGGPAFPFEPQRFMKDEVTGEITPAGSFGMSLRDWFAGHAPITIADAALVGGWNETETFSDDLTRGIMFSTLALMRYEYADAMLNERSRERAK